MSLKAKIEAVIYAAEEPVTLAQLVGLLGHEAQAELDRLVPAQQSLSLNETEADLEAAALSDPTLLPDFAGGTPQAEDQTSPVPSEPSCAPDEALAEPSSEEQVLGAAAPASRAADPRAAAREEKESARRLREHFRSLIDQLIADYATSDRGLEIREVAGGFRLSTKAEYHDAVRGFVKSLKPALKLTLQALETLAVVAYKQPVTGPEISEIRGVDSGGVLGSLMARKLITTAGRKPVIGRPILYKTTKDFLLRFGLKDINELPSIEEFEKMAGELTDNDPIQEEIPMRHQAPEGPDDLLPERDTHESQADGAAEEQGSEATDNRRAEDGDGSLAAEDGSLADEVSIDGRLSGLPPNYDDAADDPSAQEAEIQNRDNPDAT